MTLKKEELSLLRKLNKKISRAENSSEEPVMKSYVFSIKAARKERVDVIIAASRQEAEEQMFQKYGDLSYELIEVRSHN